MPLVGEGVADFCDFLCCCITLAVNWVGEVRDSVEWEDDDDPLGSAAIPFCLINPFTSGLDYKMQAHMQTLFKFECIDHVSLSGGERKWLSVKTRHKND